MAARFPPARSVSPVGSEPPGPPYPQAPAGQPGAYPAYGAPYDPYPPYPPPYGPYAPYGAYGGAYGAPFRSPEAGSLRTQAIVVLVVSLLSVVMCCFPLGIAATITSAIALSNVDSDLVRARTLVRWSWGLLVASLVLAVLALVGLVAIGAFSEPSGV